MTKALFEVKPEATWFKNNGYELETKDQNGTGEVWTTMLWECYASLLRDTLGDKPRFTFEQAQQRMKEYLVASLRATPVNPTFLEARDALLAVAYALDKTDYAEFWQAFAKRGAGVNAVAPERFSTANLGGVEDFSLGGAMTISSISIDDSIDSCQTNGLLDGGETGALRITLRNTGTNRLEATHIALSTADSHLKFANGGAADVAATNPGENVAVKIRHDAAVASGIGERGCDERGAGVGIGLGVANTGTADLWAGHAEIRILRPHLLEQPVEILLVVWGLDVHDRR